MHWVCIIENQWVLQICHTSHIMLHAQCEAQINMMNSYATGISEIIPFGGLSNRASLEEKVSDLIYQQGTVTNYELFLSKLGNIYFTGVASKHLLNQYHKKKYTLKNVTATKILLIEQNPAGYTGKKFLPFEHTYIFHHYHITHQASHVLI